MPKPQSNIGKLLTFGKYAGDLRHFTKLLKAVYFSPRILLDPVMITSVKWGRKR